MANSAINSSFVADKIFAAFNAVAEIITVLKMRVFAPVFRVASVAKE